MQEVGMRHNYIYQYSVAASESYLGFILALGMLIYSDPHIMIQPSTQLYFRRLMVVVYTVLIQASYLDYYTLKEYSGTTFRKPSDFYGSKVDKILTYQDCYFIGVFQMKYELEGVNRQFTRWQVSTSDGMSPLGNKPWVIFLYPYFPSEIRNQTRLSSGRGIGGLLVIFQEDLWNLDWEFGLVLIIKNQTGCRLTGVSENITGLSTRIMLSTDLAFYTQQ